MIKSIMEKKKKAIPVPLAEEAHTYFKTILKCPLKPRDKPDWVENKHISHIWEVY